MAEGSGKPANDEQPSIGLPTALVRKVQAVVSRVSESDRLVQRAQVREAATRTELTLALCEALVGRAETLLKARDDAFAAYLRAAAPKVTRCRRTRLGRVLNRFLGRLGWPGQALIVAWSGVWRGSGPAGRRRWRDLFAMASYARRGPDPKAVPRALVDQAWYLARYPGAATGFSPLAHYLAFGGDQNRAPHPLFDSAFYRSRNTVELASTGLTPLEHFLRIGAAQGRDPHPLFSIRHYVAQAPAAAQAENPLDHYLDAGWRQDLSPHPLFDATWYRRQLAGLDTDQPALVHYLASGWAAGLRPHPLFDPLWYLERYPDVDAAGFEPLTHFVVAGGVDRRDPSPWFDSAHYLAARGAGPFYDANPLVDYLAGGAWQVGEARPGFASTAYLASQPDLVRQGVPPLDHWARLAGD